MLLDGDDGALLDHCLVCFIISLGKVVVPEEDNVLTKHIQTRGLACSSDGLKILANVGEGFLGVFLIPLGPVLPVEVVVVFNFSSMLEV